MYLGQWNAQESHEHLMEHQVPHGDSPFQQNRKRGDKARHRQIVPEAALRCGSAWQDPGSAGLEKEEGAALCWWVEIPGSTRVSKPLDVFLFL